MEKKTQNDKVSKELLNIKGDGSKKAIIRSLMEPKCHNEISEHRETFKVKPLKLHLYSKVSEVVIYIPGEQPTVVTSGVVSDLYRPLVERSELFGRLDSFLPRIKGANEALQTKTEEEVRELDIENVEGCDSVVQMNLLLGQMEDGSSSDSEEELETLQMPGADSSKTSKKSLITEIPQNDSNQLNDDQTS